MVAWGPVCGGLRDGGCAGCVCVFTGPLYFVHSMPAGIKWPLKGGVVASGELLKGGIAGCHARNGMGRIAALPGSEHLLRAIQTCIGPRCP